MLKFGVEDRVVGWLRGVSHFLRGLHDIPTPRLDFFLISFNPGRRNKRRSTSRQANTGSSDN
eukprot:7377119-Prorocentrum_lima.AAC.1